MKIYLAGFKSLAGKITNKTHNDVHLLSSFYEHKNGKYGDYVEQEKHILDSGAFSAINDKTGKFKNFDWDKYLDKYIEFIKKTKQKLFFELDIDCVVGLKKVEYYRKKLEDAIGIAPIICWHPTRGKEYWIKSCEEYSYVALGTTIATNMGKKIRSNPAVLKWFIDHAHKNNAKIHGLGFTEMNWLDRLNFDSVDSTTWLNGGKFGEYQWFNGKIIKKRNAIGLGKKVRKDKSMELLIHNFNEWHKFQKYAEINL
tara:strand:+ start:400 stop:1164 length:765 start_codon:yes stop_codon:yes gene_type:complete